MPARRFWPLALALAGLALVSVRPLAGQAPTSSPAAFSLEQVRSYPYPTGLTAAERGARIAWAFNEQGRRNVWVAEGPAWDARPVTSYDADEGQELTSLGLSPDGSRVVYVRGGDHGSNWDDALPVNPTASPAPVSVQVWTVPFAGGEPASLGDGDNPAISPRGDLVAFERDRQIWVAPIDGSAPAHKLFTARGTNGSPAWSPDGSRLAFVSARGDHALVGIYTDEKTPILWIAPSTSRDGSPRWSPDGSRIAFIRQPGIGGPPEPMLIPRRQLWAIWVADAATGTARALWESPDTLRGSLPTTHGQTNLHYAAAGRIVFLSYVDGWPHLYSIPDGGGEPLLLTPGNFMAEHVRLSTDRRFLVFAANAGSTPYDIDRRHVLRVPVDRAAPEVLTPGTGIEWSPVVTGSGQSIAYVSATPQRPPLPAVMGVHGNSSRLIAQDRIPASFPTASLVVPKSVTYRSEDGTQVYTQIFEREGGPAKKAAVVYVHGGPPRQMLLGWHYSEYYANAYAMNQYLASRGFVVLSINYRLGIGYGFDFHRPANAGPLGASEYLDVKGAATFLKSLPRIDPARIGIYGGSYGGFLTALALARDSSVFAAGVDIHGVHDFTAVSAQRLGAGAWRYEKDDRERAAEVAWQSSPVSAVATWKSPVLLVHADDDRNVSFSQTVDLVRRLGAQGVPHEELVIVDDTHHWLRHANQLRVNAATAAFLERWLLPRENGTK